MFAPATFAPSLLSLPPTPTPSLSSCCYSYHNNSSILTVADQNQQQIKQQNQQQIKQQNQQQIKQQNQQQIKQQIKKQIKQQNKQQIKQQIRLQHAACQREEKSIVLRFKKMVQEYQETFPQSLAVPLVAAEHRLQPRRVYDFFNVLAALNVCSQIDKSTLVWRGVSQAKATIEDAYCGFEISSLSSSFEELFWLGCSPSLGTLATSFMSLFFSLGVRVLPLHQVSSLFSRRCSDTRSLERRLYLVLSLLEIMEFLTHTNRTGDYVLAVEPAPFVARAMEAKKEAADSAAAKLDSNSATVARELPEALLSRLDTPYVVSMQIERQRIFAKYQKNDKATISI